MGHWRYSPHDGRDAYFLSALLSSLLSLVVLLSLCLFRRLRDKLFMRLLSLISLCDLLANLSVLRGVPSQRGQCVLQALLQQFFYPASWMWTTLLAGLLHQLVIHGRIDARLREWHMHLGVWGFALIITVLPLSTSTYGQSSNDDDWCWLQPSERYYNSSFDWAEFWEWVTFECVIFGCFALMMYWGISIYYRLRVQQIPTTQTILTALRALLMYPIVLLVTWVPNAVVLVSGTEESASTTEMLIINSLSIWQGGLTAIIFIINSKECRAHWFALFKWLLPCFFNKQTLRPSGAHTNATLSTDPPKTNSNPNPNSTNSSNNGFFMRFRHSFDINVTTTTDIEEDFASDDAYYGVEQKEGFDDNRDSSIALSVFQNPMYQSKS